MKALRTPGLRQCKVIWSLATPYAGTACLVRKGLEPLTKSFHFPGEAPGHDVEGRVILLEFPSFYLLNTYAPNNKMCEERFARRRMWGE